VKVITILSLLLLSCTIRVYDQRPIVGIDTLYVALPTAYPTNIANFISALKTLSGFTVVNQDVVNDTTVVLWLDVSGIEKVVTYVYSNKSWNIK